MKRVLNVGGHSKDIRIPSHYEGWEHVLLDIDPDVDPDVLCDARDLVDLPGAQFDAIYCSHNLEHYWRHDLPDVLAGFAHVLRDDGFVEIAVPDLVAVFAKMRERGLDIDDVLYVSPSGPITANDVIYGYGLRIAEGNEFFAHRNSFTPKSLKAALTRAGFDWMCHRTGALEIHAFAFKRTPTPEQCRALGLPSG